MTLDPWSDPDYVLDKLRDDLLDFPVPCAICGGEGAVRLVSLAPEHIFFGPIVPLRGICSVCWEAREVRIRMSNEGAR